MDVMDLVKNAPGLLDALKSAGGLGALAGKLFK